MSPDWSDKPTSVPYAEYSLPQSLNLYHYLAGNPLVKPDKDGHCWPFCTVAAGAAIGAIAGGAGEWVHQQINGETTDWAKVGKASLAGAVAGAAVGLVGPGGAVTAPLLAGAGGVIAGQTERMLSGDTKPAIKTDATNFAVAATTSAIVDGGAERTLSSEGISKVTSETVKAIVDVGKTELTSNQATERPATKVQGAAGCVTGGCGDAGQH